ncbi:MAG: YidC/Oxa1 family rane protein insertase [Thermoleophilaceae bacterium]|nr:YidC/Oxa1 family rane protein insertase [Thermoleophilaceae bacterium]
MFLYLANIFQPLIDVNTAIVKFWHDTVGLGWGLSIIGLTMTVRLAILPLTFRQVRSMQGLQKLQPEMKKLQERYKEDKKRQQQEMMKLYQEHQINPLGSCLPLLLQLPFFFGLYQTLKPHGEVTKDIQALPKSDDGFLFIKDLTEKASHHTGVLIALLVIYLITQLGSSYVSAVNIQDKNQKRLLFMMPIFFSFIIIQFPAGLIVYWITTNVWTVGQQLFVKRFLPPPELKATPLDPGKSGPSSKADGKPARGRAAGAGATAEKPKSRRGGAVAAKSPGDGGNGRPSKPPPSSPRKKKKRSGRRR